MYPLVRKDFCANSFANMYNLPERQRNDLLFWPCKSEFSSERTVCKSTICLSNKFPEKGPTPGVPFTQDMEAHIHKGFNSLILPAWCLRVMSNQHDVVASPVFKLEFNPTYQLERLSMCCVCDTQNIVLACFAFL